MGQLMYDISFYYLFILVSIENMSSNLYEYGHFTSLITILIPTHWKLNCNLILNWFDTDKYTTFKCFFNYSSIQVC